MGQQQLPVSSVSEVTLILGTGSGVQLFGAMLCHLPWAKDWALLHFYIPTFLFTFICSYLWSTAKKHFCRPKGLIFLQLGLSPCSHLHLVIISPHSSSTSYPFLFGLHLSGNLSFTGLCVSLVAARSGGPVSV